MARYNIVRKVKDKQGNVWLRDQYGGWTNEYGVRFTKTEHRRFGYLVRKANKAILSYRQKYPSTRATKSTDVASRLRKADLARFRRKSSYLNYLKTTQRIITGEQFYKRQPKQFVNNYITALNNNVINGVLRTRPDLARQRKEIISKLKQLTPEEVIQLSNSPTLPEINEWYVTNTGVIETDFESILETINAVA